MAYRLFLAVLLLVLGPGPAARSAPPPGGPFQKVNLWQLDGFRRELTLRLIHRLQDPSFRSLLTSRLAPETRRLNLTRLVADYAQLWPAPDHQSFLAHIQDLDRDLGRSKGLAGHDPELLGLEVIWPKDGPRRIDWETVLFGVGPQGPKRSVREIEAYDLQGRPHPLDAHTPPAVPVLMAGLDRGAAKRAGLALVNAGLRRANLAPAAPGPPALEPIPCSKLTYIRLKDDQEPWWKGAAEVYAFTAGVDPLVDKPSIKLIDLPYLGYDQTDYFPNQLILFWSDWRFNAADFQLWECDDGTNYQDILAAVLSAVTAAMTLGGAPAFAWIPALAKAIIEAMPAAWYKDNDDYLDTFYTLEKGRCYQRLTGAANNATLSLAPFLLQPTVPARP